MGMAASCYYTRDMVRTLPDDGNRYETVHGELLVTPAPVAWHQELVGRLSQLLRDYLRREPVAHVFLAPADISWSSDTLVQPDLCTVPLEEARTLEWEQMKSLLLAVEVLSPGTARHDRFTKRRLYQEVGVPCYWIVCPDQAAVEVWEPADTLPTVKRDKVTWWPAGAREPLTVLLPELFQEI